MRAGTAALLAWMKTPLAWVRNLRPWLNALLVWLLVWLRRLTGALPGWRSRLTARFQTPASRADQSPRGYGQPPRTSPRWPGQVPAWLSQPPAPARGSLAWFRAAPSRLRRPGGWLDRPPSWPGRRPGGQRRRSQAWVLALLIAVCAVVVAVAKSTGGTPAPGPPPAPLSGSPAGQPSLGPHVYIFGPGMPQAQIQSAVNAIARQQLGNQFGSQRYALLFEPGTYGSAAHPLSFQVGYYTQVAGLGSQPSDVTINGAIDVSDRCRAGESAGSQRCTALENFWRSLSNLTIHVTGQHGCQAGTDFWAVSQAAPMRRVDITGGTLSLTDSCSAGPRYGSGGFIADSRFADAVTDGSQQQFLVRNSYLDGWGNGGWNEVFAGDTGAPGQSFSASSGRASGTQAHTTLAASPVSQEEPFLSESAHGYQVIVPPVRRDSTGTSWASAGSPGTALAIQRFFIAEPGTSVSAINAALASGKDLILTPGIYHLSQTIEVTHPGTVVLGLGFPTLIPAHGIVSMRVADVPGVKLSGMIFDAGPVRSPVLLQVGDPSAQGRAGQGTPADPTLVQDVFFRVGGAEAGQATVSMVVNSSDVILDDIWAWRADHGTGVGWDDNVADTGLVVNGDQVTAYGLFVEHYEQYQVVWNGQDGTDIFFQNEMPYDPPSQSAWTADSRTEGYPALLVGSNVTSFHGYGMGSYSDFNRGVAIRATSAFQVPNTPGVRLTDVLTYFLNGSGGINHVADEAGSAVSNSSPGPSNVATFPAPVRHISPRHQRRHTRH